MSKTGRSRPFGKLALFVVVLVAGWSAFWWYIRGEIEKGVDLFMADAAENGVELTCKDRTIGGWPFRIEIACREPSALMADGTSLEARALKVSGLVYHPEHYVADIIGPFSGSRRGETLAADWASLRASLALSSGELDRLSVVTDGLKATLTSAQRPDQSLTLKHGEAHVVAVAEGAAASPVLASYDLAGSVQEAAATAEGKSLTGAPVDASLDARVSNVRRGAELNGRAFANAGGRIQLRQAIVDFGDTAFSAAGPVAVDPDGRLNGELKVASIARPEARPAAPKPPIMAAMMGTFLIMGTAAKDDQGRDARTLDLVIERGQMRLGRMPLGTLRPLF